MLDTVKYFTQIDIVKFLFQCNFSFIYAIPAAVHVNLFWLWSCFVMLLWSWLALNSFWLKSLEIFSLHLHLCLHFKQWDWASSILWRCRVGCCFKNASICTNEWCEIVGQSGTGYLGCTAHSMCLSRSQNFQQGYLVQVAAVDAGAGGTDRPPCAGHSHRCCDFDAHCHCARFPETNGGVLRVPCTGSRAHSHQWVGRDWKRRDVDFAGQRSGKPGARAQECRHGWAGAVQCGVCFDRREQPGVAVLPWFMLGCRLRWKDDEQITRLARLSRPFRWKKSINDGDYSLEETGEGEKNTSEEQNTQSRRHRNTRQAQT